jgi:hypothetical protein
MRGSKHSGEHDNDTHGTRPRESKLFLQMAERAALARSYPADKVDLIIWRDALDLFGRRTSSGIPDDVVASALALARQSGHGDAQWLVSLVPAEGSVTSEELARALQPHGEEPRALFVCAGLSGRVELMKRAAEAGYAPAQGKLASMPDVFSADEQKRWAELAMSQGDRDGAFYLASLLSHGSTHVVEQEKAAVLSLYRVAAELGDATAQDHLALFAYQKSDWQRFFWWGRAASRGSVRSCTLLLKGAVCAKTLDASGRVAFEIGAACKDHLTATRAFGRHAEVNDLQAAIRCVEFYDTCCEKVRASIRCWLLVGRRSGVAKDIRLLIARLLWEERREWCRGEFS